MLSLIASSGALLAVKSAFLGLRVLTLLAVAKHGPSGDLALISFAIAMAELGRLFADFGTDTWSVRSLVMAENHAQRTRVLGTAAVIKLAGGLIAWPGLLIACVFSFSSAGNLPGLIAGILLGASQCAGLATAYFQAQDRLGALAIRVVPYAVLAAGLIVATSTIASNALLTLSMLAACEVFIACVLVTLLRRERALPPMGAWFAGVRDGLRSSLPFAAFGMVVGLYSRLDTIVLAQVSLTALATYTVAQRLSQPFQAAATAFGAIVYRKTAVAVASRRRFMHNLLLRDLPVVLTTVSGISVSLWYMGGIVVDEVLPQYSAALAPFGILCATLPVLAVNAALAGVLLALDRASTVLCIAILDLVALATAMFVLVPAHGAIGVSLALAIGAGANCLAQCTCVWLNVRGYASVPVAEAHDRAS